MTRLGITNIFVLALANLCIAQDVRLTIPGILSRPTEVIEWHCTVPAQRANAARSAISRAIPGSLIECGPGNFDFGNTAVPPNVIRLPKDVTIRGAGMERTRWLNSWADNAAAGCCFEAADGSVIEDISLESTCNLNQQALTWGFAARESGNNAHAIARRCKFVGRAWCVYSWQTTDYGTKLELFDCEIHGAKWLVAIGQSSGPECAFIDLHRCRLFGDSLNSTYVGAVGMRLAGFCARGGRIRAYDSVVDLKGDPRMEFVASAWPNSAPDHQDWGKGEWPLIELHNVTSRVQGVKAWDINQEIGRVAQWGGTGSGDNGTWTRIENFRPREKPDSREH